MTRAKKNPIPPSNTSHLFGGRKPGDRSAEVTSEHIADDLEAFRKAGGRVEVLGNTRVLTRIDGTPAVPAPQPQKPAKRPAPAPKP